MRTNGMVEQTDRVYKKLQTLVRMYPARPIVRDNLYAFAIGCTTYYTKDNVYTTLFKDGINDKTLEMAGSYALFKVDLKLNKMSHREEELIKKTKRLLNNYYDVI